MRRKQRSPRAGRAHTLCRRLDHATIEEFGVAVAVQAPATTPGLLPQGPVFRTSRFALVPVTPAHARELCFGLLKDAQLAGRIRDILELAGDEADKHAFHVESLSTQGHMKVWAINDQRPSLPIGAILARSSPKGFEVDVLVTSPYWDCGVAEEVGRPVAQWLLDNPATLYPIHRTSQ